MHHTHDLGSRLPELVNDLVVGYHAQPRIHHIDRAYLPSRGKVIELSERLLELVYPGFYGRQNLTRHNVAYHVGELLPRIAQLAQAQIVKALRYRDEIEGTAEDAEPEPGRYETEAVSLIDRFLRRLPALRKVLAGDAQAAYDGDPAALNCDEIILAYPGTRAIAVYRLAHELFELGVPLLPRMMTEWAHSHTGVDIHPGARIGRNFFIDHATGVVIGETTDIGDHVKLYQGVTLGALSFPKDERGRLIRGTKRHPTVRDHVTIYANAIILGGDTVIGEHSVIGGSVFLTSSVPPYSTVTFHAPALKVRDRDGRAGRKGEQELTVPDYQI